MANFVETIIVQVKTFAGSYITEVWKAINTNFGPTLKVALILYVIVYGWMVMQNKVSDTFGEAVRRIVAMSIVVALCTDYSSFNYWIYQLFWQSGVTEFSKVMMAGTGGLDPSLAGKDAFSALGLFWEKSNDVYKVIAEMGGWRTRWPYVAAGWIVIALALTATALFAILIGMLALAVFLGLAPIFIPFVLFENTRALFDGWLRNILQYTFLPLIVAGVISLLMHIVYKNIMSVPAGGITGEQVFINCILVLVGIMFMKQVMSIAQSLTASVALASNAFATAMKAAPAAWGATKMMGRGTRAAYKGTGAQRAFQAAVNKLSGTDKIRKGR